MGKGGGAGTTYDYYGTIACGLSVYQTDDVIGWILNGEAVWPQGNAWPAGGATFNVTSGQMYVYDAQTWVAQQNFTVPANPSNTDNTIPGNDAAYWVEYTFPRPGSFSGAESSTFTLTDPTSDTTYGNLEFYWGLSTQLVDPVLNGANDSGDVHPNYASVSYCLPGPGTTPGGNTNGFLLGQEVQSAPSIEGILRRATVQTVVTGTPTTIVDGQCNLAAVMAEILTGVNGIGLPAAALDATSFNAVATYLQSNELLYGASPMIDTSDTLRSVCDQFTQMIDGFIRYNPATELIEMGVYQHGVTPTLNTASVGSAPNGVLTLTEDSLTERPQLKTTSWQGTYSRATVRYNDRQLNFQQTSLHADDARAWAVLKSVREISLDRPWITRAEQALLHGRETLRVVGHAQMTGTLSVRREIGRNIRGGDYVLLDVDIEPNETTVYQFFRVTKRTIPMTGPIKLEVLADNTLAAIPASNVGAPVIGQNTAVPAVSYARICEVPTQLSGERGAVACLVQRSGTLVTGCGVYFDTSTGGTFPLLGSFNGFAARGTLAANITASATTATVNVDTTQPDADFFTQQFSANEQSDDAMLAFIVQYGTVSGDPGTSDGGQIAEAGNGYALMEICSVSTTTLVSAGQYTISVLRARQGSVAQAFTSADSEVWLIPRANLVTFTNAIFPTLRGNRAAGTTPVYGLFRFCPTTFTGSYPLSGAASWSFRFALNSPSVPVLSLSAPASLSGETFTSQPYPIQVPVQGTWTDPDGQLVQLTVQLVPSGGSARTILNQTFAPIASYTFTTAAQIDGAGTYALVITARDSQNFSSTVTIPYTAIGTAPTCANVDVFDADGNQLSAGNGLLNDVLLEFVANGPMSLNCTTPGAVITFNTTGPILNNGALEFSDATLTYEAGVCTPYCAPFAGVQGDYAPGVQLYPQISFTLQVQASASGYTASGKVQYKVPLTLIEQGYTA